MSPHSSRKGAPLLHVLALPLLGRAGGQNAAAASVSQFGFFPGPLRMPPSPTVPPTAAGDEREKDGDEAIKASVASLLSFPAVQALAGEEGSKRRALVERGALSSMSMAEKLRTHKYVQPAYERTMDGVHSREEVLKAADDALAQAHALRRKRKEEEEEEGKVLEVELVYPEGFEAEGVREGWLAFVEASQSHHATMKTRSLCLLPVTSAFSLLPLPNVFFLWNAFRVYSHLKSTRGAEGLNKRLSPHHYTLRADAELGHVFNTQGRKEEEGEGAGAFEKGLVEVGMRYEVEDLPRLYRRWTPIAT